MSKFLSTSGFKWIDPKDFDLNKYNKNSSKRRIFEVFFKYLKKLCELHNDYPLALEKIEIIKEVLSIYQLMIAVKTLVPNCFDKQTFVLHYENFQFYLGLRLN